MIKDGNLRIYTISELGQYLDCPRRYFYSYDQALESKKFQGVPLDVGHALHQGVAEMYAGVTKDEAVDAAVETYKIHTAPWWLTAEEGTKEWQKLVTGREQIRVCLEQYPWLESDFDTTEVIEESFVIPMGQGTAYGGRWDRSVGFDGNSFLHDTKSTGSPLEQIAKAHKMRMQYKAYAYAWERVKGCRVDGFVVDFIKKPRVNFRRNGELSSVSDPDYLREPMYIKEHDYLDFPAWFNRVVQSIECDRRCVESHGVSNATVMPYPLNTGSCDKWGRRCEFFDLCQLGYINDKLKDTMFKKKEVLHGRDYIDELSPQAREALTKAGAAEPVTRRDIDSSGGSGQ